MVLEHGVRFYCGTPLIGSNGHRLGTLCFVDSKPRKMEAHNCMILNNMCALTWRQGTMAARKPPKRSNSVLTVLRATFKMIMPA